jgi:hypothetical protein
MYLADKMLAVRAAELYGNRLSLCDFRVVVGILPAVFAAEVLCILVRDKK